MAEVSRETRERIQAYRSEHPQETYRQIAAACGCGIATVAAALSYHPAGEPEPNGEPEPAPATSPAAPVAAGELGASIAKLIEQALARPAVDEAAVLRIVKKATAHLERPIEIHLAERPEPVRLTGTHPAFEDALHILRRVGLVWLCGPMGSGKTTLARHLAKAVGSERFGMISCTAGMSESWLLGRLTVDGRYLESEFVACYERGGLFLWDEFDAGDPNVNMITNAALANGHLALPSRTALPQATRHPAFYGVVATNTWGHGADREYIGREGIDAATRDRFACAKVYVDFDPRLERTALGAHDWSPAKPFRVGPLRGIPEGFDPLSYAFAQIRRNVAKSNIRRVVSPRAYLQAAQLRAEPNGWSNEKILSTFLVDWTDTERTKALEGIQ